MKKVVMLTVLMCVGMLFSCENKETTKLLLDTERQVEAQYKTDSLIKTVVAKINQPENKTSLESFKESIQIVKYYTSKPNSAGGVDCNIIWKNLSHKTIKYATFTVVPYNRVDDIVIGDYDYYGISSKKLSVTGPIKKNKTSGYGSLYSCVWYNSTISYMKLIGIEIEYMDGSIISTSDVGVINELGYNKK